MYLTECDREASLKKKSWPTVGGGGGDVAPWGKRIALLECTVKPRFTNASAHEQFGLRTNFPNTASGMTYCVSSYEHASRQHRGAISWEYQRRQYS